MECCELTLSQQLISSNLTFCAYPPQDGIHTFTQQYLFKLAATYLTMLHQVRSPKLNCILVKIMLILENESRPIKALMRPLIKSDWLQNVVSLIHFFMIYNLFLIFMINMSDGAFVLLKWKPFCMCFFHAASFCL